MHFPILRFDLIIHHVFCHFSISHCAITMSHIPHYVKASRWYENKGETHDFKAEGDELIDQGEATVGKGIINEELWATKRDKWLNYDLEQWEKTLKSWRDRDTAGVADDSDDTDYELELIELGLTVEDFKTNIKRNSTEQIMRDRSDIAAYIHNISAKADGKIQLKYDPKTRTIISGGEGVFASESEFAKGNGDEAVFSWEKRDQVPKEISNDHAAKLMMEQVTRRQNQRASKQHEKRRKILRIE